MPPTLLIPGNIEGNNEIPINYIINKIKKNMFEYGSESANLENRIFIIQAKTGSGKSTILPVDIFRILRNKDIPLSVKYFGPKVICTQPRVLTAIELAKDVSSLNKDMVVGVTVGYQTKPLTDKPKTGLIYATLGILLRQLTVFSDEKFMNEYKFIIIDEAHERTLGSDMALFMLYHFYKRNTGNKKLPFLILTSATIDVNKYASYFEVTSDNIISVLGQSFNITTHWPSTDINNVFEYIFTTIKTICDKNNDEVGRSDILIFLPGSKEIKSLSSILMRLKNILVLKLDSKAVENNTIDYKNLFDKKIKTRKVILSTAVAETGLTISTCKYVIDIGFHRSIESYPLINATGLITKPTSKSRITQRRGRVGRLFDGEFYPMYTEELYGLLDDQQLPEIITLSYEYNKIHLKLYKILGELDISKVNLLDKPSTETFINANSIATILGFINYNSELTELGKIASDFSYITMEQAKIILSGIVYNVSIMDLITICSFMTIDRERLFLSKNKFMKYMNENNLNYNKNILCCDAYALNISLPKFMVEGNSDSFYYKYKTLLCDDFIEALFIFEAFIKIISTYKNIDKIEQWCMENCLQLSTLQSIYYERENIIDDLLLTGFDIFTNNDKRIVDQKEDTFIENIINIKKCLYEGLKCNMIIYDEEKKIYTSRNIQVNVNSNILNKQLQNKLISMDVLNNVIIPKYIITDKLIISSDNSNKLMYSINSNFVSILDGYIYIDKTFGNPIYE